VDEKDINNSSLSVRYHKRGKYHALAVRRIEKRYLAEINLKICLDQTGITKKEQRKCFFTFDGISMPEHSVQFA